MITPQQRNAWRGAYLRQLRKIAESTPNPWMEEIEWEDNLLEDRLTQFIYQDYLRFLKTVVFVFENHPLVVSAIDNKFIMDDDTCSVSHLFQFLRSITSYGRFGVISSFDCSDDIKQELMLALRDGNEERFISMVKGINLQQIYKSIGYTSNLLFSLHYVIQMMEHKDVSDEDGNLVERIADDMGNRSFEQKTINEISNNLVSFARQNSTLRFDTLPPELEYLEEEYNCIASQWFPFSIIVDSYFMPKEFSIVESVLSKWRFADIKEDLLHLSSLVNSDYQYERIVLPLQ